MIDNSCDSSDSISEREFITQLELACQDLWWFSEAEYPLETVYWQDVKDFNEQYLLQRQDLSRETEIAIREFDNFFHSVTQPQPWHNEAEKQEVRQYQALKDLLAKNLVDLRVYLLGEIEIDVYVLGKTKQKAIAGIKTKIVQT